jgi:hypothetical protein
LTFAFICVYLRPLLRGWRYHKYLESVTLAGSHAKGTDLKDSDFDIFLRLSHVTPGPLSAMQTSLADHLHGHVRNVAVRILFEGRFIDLVPARGNVLWQARYNTWLKTDIAEQIRYVRSSGLIDEILALKIWRRRLPSASRLSSWSSPPSTLARRTSGSCFIFWQPTSPPLASSTPPTPTTSFPTSSPKSKNSASPAGRLLAWGAGFSPRGDSSPPKPPDHP